MKGSPRPPLLVRGDIDGFFGLALDNLVQLLVIVSLCATVLGFDAELLQGRVLPGVAVSLLVGNLFYAWQARRLAAATGRTDVCALPYGINTPSLFLFVFLVMLPTRLAALGDGATEAEAARAAWRAGLLACFGSGVIEAAGALVADRIRSATPRAALLSTLSGVAIGFIAMPFAFRAFAHPLVGIVPLVVVFAAYFGRVRFRGGLPGGLMAVGLGTGLAWLTGVAPSATDVGVGFFAPVPVVGDLLTAFSDTRTPAFLSVVVAMGLFNVLGSLQNVESAEAAGDAYPTGPSLAANGIGTIAAASFGSCFPTTIYIGHPGWKALGARSGYSVLNGAFCTIVCLTGTVGAIAWAVPVDAAMSIVIWIALVITAQAFQATERREAPAVVVGLIPGIAAWGVWMLKGGLRAAGLGTPDHPFDASLAGPLAAQDVVAAGAFALEQGALFTAMILAAATTAIIHAQFRRAAVWCLVAAALSATGLMHGYRYAVGDVVLALGPTWPFVRAYAAAAVVLFVMPWVTTRNPDA